MPKNLRILPKLRDSLTFLYIEHAIVEQDALAIVKIQGESRVPIPIAAMTVLMLGPGVSITHAAIRTVTDSGCTIVWCGERASRFYAPGLSETRSSKNLLWQAGLCMDKALHLEVVKRMYARRFPEMSCEGMTLQQIRGMEGVRMREAYKLASKASGVKWSKRDYKTNDWDDSDDINKALSYANTILYGLCQGAIVSLGFSTGLGFIHTGKMLSFVYDVADLYKADTTIPAAFQAVAEDNADMERRVRLECRRLFKAHKVLERIPKDLEWVLMMDETSERIDALSTGELWDDTLGSIEGGKNYSNEE